MVVLMVAVTLLTIFTAASLPLWTQAMKREKEAELIFRGWQYAEAIRVFQQRHGRYPTRLEELMEVKPRSIRKLWKDPVTDDGEWGLVFQGDVAPPGGQGGQPLGEGGAPGGGGGRSGGRNEGDGGQPGRATGPRPPRPGEERTVGPIVGVRSLSDEESLKVLFDEERYDRWLFTAEKVVRTVSGGGQVGFGGGRTHPSPVIPRLEWRGKPFPGNLQPEQGQPPGGQKLGPEERPSGPGGRPRGDAPPGRGKSRRP